MKLIDADAVGARLSPTMLVEALRAGHGAGGMGEVERLLVSRGADSALTWAGWHPDRGLAIKTATVFPGNVRLGRPNIQSVVTLFDGKDGAPLASIHGESFTRMKTAADSALGADILARRDADVLAVLGAGGQAETHIRFMLAMRPTLRRVLLWNRSGAAARALASRLAAPGIAFNAVDELRAAVEPAAIVSCLTAAETPVLRGAWLCPGAHVDLVGGYTPAMRESDDDVILRGRLFADSMRFGVETCGDYAQPIARGVIGRDKILGDLFDLCGGALRGRTAPEDITVLKNGGGGHLDLMAARAFYEASLG